MGAKTRQLIASQLKILRRDTLLLFLVVYPLILTFIGRMIIPIIGRALVGQGIEIAAHYPALMVFFVVMNPVVFGAVMGLMLLDERESTTIAAILVLPVKFSHYVLTKAAMFTLLSVISGMLVTVGIGLYHVPLWDSFLINLLASAGVLFEMLLVNMFAKNKVEGFASMKASGFLLIAPVVALYMPEPWSYIFGLAPAFWPSVAIASHSEYYTAGVNSYILLAVGAIYITLLSYAMYKVTVRRML